MKNNSPKYQERYGNHERNRVFHQLIMNRRKLHEALIDIEATFQEIFQYLLGKGVDGDYTKSIDQSIESTGKNATLYTLVKYEGKDKLINVGEGQFNTQVFTTTGKPEIKGFYLNNLPLFVVEANYSTLANEEVQALREVNPREYLEKYAEIVSPKGGSAYIRTSKDMEQKIDYGPIIVREYDEAVKIAKYTVLEKSFPREKIKDALDKIKLMQKLDFDTFRGRILNMKVDPDDKDIEPKVICCLRNKNIDELEDHIYSIKKGERSAYIDEIMSLYKIVISFEEPK